MSLNPPPTITETNPSGTQTPTPTLKLYPPWPYPLLSCVSATHFHCGVRRDVPLPHLRGGVHGGGDPERDGPQDWGEEEAALRQGGGHGHGKAEGACVKVPLLSLSLSLLRLAVLSGLKSI